MSDSLIFWANRSFAHFWTKIERFARKSNERIPSPGGKRWKAGDGRWEMTGDRRREMWRGEGATRGSPQSLKCREFLTYFSCVTRQRFIFFKSHTASRLKVLPSCKWCGDALTRIMPRVPSSDENIVAAKHSKYLRFPFFSAQRGDINLVTLCI